MKRNRFNPGDIVHLVSGGPPMMEDARLVGKRVYCRWFTIDGIAQEETFQVDCLRPWPGGRWQPSEEEQLIAEGRKAIAKGDVVGTDQLLHNLRGRIRRQKNDLRQRKGHRKS